MLSDDEAIRAIMGHLRYIFKKPKLAPISYHLQRLTQNVIILNQQNLEENKSTYGLNNKQQQHQQN
jgi:hypothetical protein